MATKAELEEKNRKLRAALKQLKEELDTIKSTVSTRGAMPLKAFSCFKQGNVFKKAIINFNPLTMRAVVEEVSDASRVPSSFAMASQYVHQMAEDIVMRQELELEDES